MLKHQLVSDAMLCSVTFVNFATQRVFDRRRLKLTQEAAKVEKVLYLFLVVFQPGTRPHICPLLGLTVTCMAIAIH